MRAWNVGLVIVAAVLVGGCGSSHYRVTDPSTGSVYYTTEVKKRSNGAVQIKDASSGDTVTLQNSQVSKVSKEEYETNLAGKKAM